MKKYKVTYLIDIISKNPDDYTIKKIVEAKNEIDAVKKVAISITNKNSHKWISDIKGNLEEVLDELMRLDYCITDVCAL